MKKLIFLYCLPLFFSSVLYSQAPTIAWQKSLGGTGQDKAASIQQTSDGGYIVAGYSYSNNGNVTGNHGGVDYWLVKLNNVGAITWQKSLGGTGQDIATSVQQTSDGGYIVAGSSSSNDGDVTGHHGGVDYWIVKINNTGGILWEKSLGGTDDDAATSIQQTSDGGYIVAGSSSSNDGDVSGLHGNGSYIDYWVVKLNNSGGIIWQKCLGGSLQDIAYSIQQTSDGGYIVAGSSTSNDGDVAGNHGGIDYWIVKLDNVGVITWQKSLGGTDNEFAYSIQQTSDGGYIVAGYTSSNDGDVSGRHGGVPNTDYWVVKLDNSGGIIWQKCLGGSFSDEATSIQQTSDGGYIVAGSSSSNDGDVTGHHGTNAPSDYWIVKINNTEGILWEKSLGGSGDDKATSIQQTIDGGYIVAGYSSSNDGDVTGHHGVISYQDYWIVKLAPDNITGVEDIKIDFSLSPNPALTQLTLQTSTAQKTSYTLYDLTGRILHTGNFMQNTTINVEDFASGTYYIQFSSKENFSTQKFIKQ